MAKYHLTEANNDHPPPHTPAWLGLRYRFIPRPPIVPAVRDMLTREALRRHGADCHWCGRPTVRATGPRMEPNSRTLEHLIPRAMGGLDTIANTRIACAECNFKRGVESQWAVWLHRLKGFAPNKLYGAYIKRDEAV